MTTPIKLLLAVLTLVAIGGASWLVLRPATAISDFSESFDDQADGEDSDFGPVDAAAALGGDGTDAERVASSNGGGEPPAETKPASDKQAATVAGRVVDGSGTPVGEAEVSVFLRRRQDPRGRGRPGRYEPAAKPVQTAPDGTYRVAVEVFDRTSLEVVATHASFAPALLHTDWDPRAGQPAPAPAPDEPPVPGNHVKELPDLVLAAGTTVFGRVVSESGAPLAAAEVRYRTHEWPQKARLNEILKPMRCDELGRFEISNVPPGPFDIQGRLRGYLPATTKRLTAKPGLRIDGGVITLVLGAEVSGIVKDRRGNPIAGAEIQGMLSFSAEGERIAKQLEDLRVIARAGNQRGPDRERASELYETFRQSRGLRERARTNGAGEFRLDGLPKGPLRLEVRHGKFIDEIQEPVDASSGRQRVEIVMFRRLAVTGTIVDAIGGVAVTRFGIRARRIGDVRAAPGEAAARRNDPWLVHAKVEHEKRKAEAMRADQERALRAVKQAAAQAARVSALQKQRAKLTPQQRQKLAERERAEAEKRAKRAARQQVQRAQRDADRAVRTASRTARRTTRDAYMKQRLGPSGRLPGSIPTPTDHEAGKFTIEGLMPGEYVFDVGGPGYVKQAAGPFMLERGKPIPDVTIRLERGIEIRGVVLNRANGQPIAGAEITLFLPGFEPEKRPDDPLVQALHPREEGMRLDRAVTDVAGRFEIAPQKTGQFVLTVRAEEFNPQRIESFSVQRGQDVEGLLFQLGPAARVYGMVQNPAADAEYQVVLVSTEGAKKFVPVDPQTHRYEATGLAAGDWFVRLNKVGQPGGLFRQAVEAVTRPGASKPDLRLAEGANVEFHVDAGQNDLGTLEGHVTWNGKPAGGLELRLQPHQGTISTAAVQDKRGEELVRRILGGVLRGHTNREGRFKIEMIPPGTYTVEVRRNDRDRGRRRGRGGNVVSKHVAMIGKGMATPLAIRIETGKLELTAVDAASGKPAHGRVLLALMHEAEGKQPKDWRSLESFESTDLRGGKARIDTIAAGGYRYFAWGGGYEPIRGELFIGAGTTTTQALRFARPPRPAQKAQGGARGKK